MPKISPDGINRSDEIRKYFNANPSAGIKDCIDALKEVGIEVSYSLVASVRSRHKDKGPEGPVTVDELRRVHDFISVSNLDTDVAIRILRDFADLVQVSGGLSRFRLILDQFSAGLADCAGEGRYQDVNEDGD